MKVVVVVEASDFSLSTSGGHFAHDLGDGFKHGGCQLSLFLEDLGEVFGGSVESVDVLFQESFGWSHFRGFLCRL
jgi:hypothetical protein